jgi:hypothetical protein
MAGSTWVLLPSVHSLTAVFNPLESVGKLLSGMNLIPGLHDEILSITTVLHSVGVGMFIDRSLRVTRRGSEGRNETGEIFVTFVSAPPNRAGGSGGL